MAGLFEIVGTEDPNFLSSSEENAKRAEIAAANAAASADEASASAASAKDSMGKAAGAVTGVGLFNERFGNVYPMAGDYTAAMVKARPDNWVPSWNDVTGKPRVASLDQSQTFIGISTFNGIIDSDRRGLAFGNNNSTLSFNVTTNDLEVQRGDTQASVGIEPNGRLFTRQNSTTAKTYYASDSTSFNSSFTASFNYKALDNSVQYDLNQSDASVFSTTLTNTTTTINLVPFTLPTTSARQITLFLTQGSGGSKIVNWSSNIKWSQGRKPTLSLDASTTDVISFLTLDNGNTWFGFFNGGWF